MCVHRLLISLTVVCVWSESINEHESEQQRVLFSESGS